jgi:hypothetical protein
MRATWRERADRLESQTLPVQVKTIAGSATGATDVYYVRGLRQGVYTFTLEAPPGARAPVGATLYLPLVGEAGIRRVTSLRPNTVGRVLVGKLLYPLGMLWDRDEWSSGRSESSDTITKFNMDGVSWIERKAEFR